MANNEQNTRCGFVAVIGAPNAGKSTLINALVGGKVSIVSSKVQTTRMPIRGIIVKDQSQIVFIDTPGLFRPQRRLERAMVAAAWDSGNEADIVVVVCDASSQKAIRETKEIIARLKDGEETAGKTCVLVFNKTDLISPPQLLPLAQDFNNLHDFAATFMIAASRGNGVADLLSWLTRTMPEGPWHYPADQISDMPERLMAAEITREKLFRRLHEELPHALAVETEKWESRDDGSIMIHQIITVERDSQKSIVLGRGGSMIKVVGQDARLEMSEIFGAPVHLKLFVKVHEDWAEDPEHYRAMGLDFRA